MGIRIANFTYNETGLTLPDAYFNISNVTIRSVPTPGAATLRIKYKANLYTNKAMRLAGKSPVASRVFSMAGDQTTTFANIYQNLSNKFDGSYTVTNDTADEY